MNYQKPPTCLVIFDRTLNSNNELAMSSRSTSKKITKVSNVGLNKSRTWTLSSYMEDSGRKPGAKSPPMDQNNDIGPCSTWSLSDTIAEVTNKAEENPIPRLQQTASSYMADIGRKTGAKSTPKDKNKSHNNDTGPCSTWSLSDTIAEVTNKAEENPIPRCQQTSTSSLKHFDTIDVSIFEQVLSTPKKLSKKTNEVVDKKPEDIPFSRLEKASAFNLKQYDDIEKEKVFNNLSSTSTPQGSPNRSRSFRFDDDSTDDGDTDKEKPNGVGAPILENEEEMNTSENLLESCDDNLLLQPELETPSKVHDIGVKRRVDPNENDETISDNTSFQASQSKKQKHSSTELFVSPSKTELPSSSTVGARRPNLLDQRMTMSQSQQSSSGFSQVSNRGVSRKKLQQFVQCKESFRKGIWVQCNTCQKWRYLKNTQDSDQVPAIWHCRSNPDLKFNDCETPQDLEYNDLQYVPSEFSVGTIKWAKLGSFPSWPALIDDNPDTKTSIWHSDPDPESGLMMTKVHVVFFDTLNGTVTRSWVDVNDTQPFKGNETLKKAAADYDSVDSASDFYDNLKLALNSAKKASKLSLQSRRSMYCTLYKTKVRNKFRY